MAVRSKEEILASLKSKLGEDVSDETIALLEDVSDTLDSTKDTTDWKQKYEDNDRQWRQKYTSRFYDGGGEVPPADNKPTDEEKAEEEKASTISINDLFTEKEK